MYLVLQNAGIRSGLWINGDSGNSAYQIWRLWQCQKSERCSNCPKSRSDPFYFRKNRTSMNGGIAFCVSGLSTVECRSLTPFVLALGSMAMGDLFGDLYVSVFVRMSVPDSFFDQIHCELSHKLRWASSTDADSMRRPRTGLIIARSAFKGGESGA